MADRTEKNKSTEETTQKKTKKSIEAIEVSEEKEISPSEDGGETPLSLRLEKLKNELRTGFREFEFEDLNEEKRRVRFYLPTIKEETLISAHKTRITSTALKDDSFMMQEEVYSILRKRGVWDEEKERKQKQLEKKISECLNEIYLQKSRKKPDQTRLDELRREKISLDIDLALLKAPKATFEEVTLESYIEREVLKYKMCLLIRDENGAPLWRDLDEYNESDLYNKHLVNTVLAEAYYFWAGVDPALFDAAPTLE